MSMTALKIEKEKTIMATFIKKGDDIVTCPYDPAHRLKRSRMQMHIAKCKLNHPDKMLKECPFNNTHRIQSHEFDHHLVNCPDRTPVDRLLAGNVDKHNLFKGHTAVPSYSTAAEVPLGESWEHEISTRPTPGYTPSTEPPAGGIILDMGITKPSYRKQVYQSLASKPKPEQTEARSPAPPKEPELRKPKQKYEDFLQKSAKFSLNHLQEQTVPSLGVGRGRARVDSRIAANIFSGGASPMQQPVNQVKNGVHGMGIGRGNPGLGSYDDDFPALGLGVSSHK